MPTPPEPSKHRPIVERFLDGLVAAGGPVVSPDGAQVAFVVGRVDLTRNKTVSQVWLAPADGSRSPRPFTAGDPGESSPAWSPDGTQLAFVSRRSEKKGQATVHVLAVDGPGEARTVATMKDGAGDLSWSPDGRWLAFTSRVPDERYDAEDESWQSARRIETFFTRLDGEGWVFDRPSHVFVVAADGTGTPRDLTPGPHQHHDLSWLADSSGLVTGAARHEGWDRDLATDLYVVPLDGEPRALTEQTGNYGSPSVSPDGTQLAFVGSDDPLTYPQNSKVGVLDLATGERRWVSEALDRTFDTTSGTVAPVWVDDATLLATAEDRGRCHLHRLDARAIDPPVALTDGDRWVRGAHAANGTVAIVVASVDRPAELALLTAGGSERAASSLTDAYVARARPQPWERFTVPSSDGTVEIDAWIMRPAGLGDDGKHPVLLNVHGGPHTQYGETFFDEFQMQAAAGYVVVLCNPRGSSGREETWGQAILGPLHPTRPGSGWGTVDVDDVLAVLDAALARYPFCDPERVGMLGGSYGGYMATWLAAHHGVRFKAICSERSVNNLLTEEWSSDIGTMFRVEHGPDPVENPGEYLRMSPIMFARDIHVPLLIVHSEEDLRCPISQADELFVTLRLLGRDVTYYRFPGEGHELSRGGSPVHRRQRAEIILDFFAEHLQPAEG
ncbi:MAG: S9 family peptidase [Ilumatobacteraceae bacterium]